MRPFKFHTINERNTLLFYWSAVKFWPLKIAWEKLTAYLLVLGCSCHTKPERCTHTVQCLVWTYVKNVFSLKANKCHFLSIIMWSTLTSRTGLSACLARFFKILYYDTHCLLLLSVWLKNSCLCANISILHPVSCCFSLNTIPENIQLLWPFIF